MRFLKLAAVNGLSDPAGRIGSRKRKILAGVDQLATAYAAAPIPPFPPAVGPSLHGSTADFRLKRHEIPFNLFCVFHG